MSPLLDCVNSAFDASNHILQKADGADPSAHEAAKNSAYNEHYSNREPREEPVLEEERDGVHCARDLGLRFYARHYWENNPRACSVECGNEAHDADSAKKHEEAQLNQCSYRPVVAPNLDSSQPGPKASRLCSFRVRNSGFLHLSRPIQRTGRTVGRAAAGRPIADRRPQPSLPRAPQAE